VGSFEISSWMLISPLILFVILIPGGFFMFRAFLGRMAPEGSPMNLKMKAKEEKKRQKALLKMQQRQQQQK